MPDPQSVRPQWRDAAAILAVGLIGVLWLLNGEAPPSKDVSPCSASDLSDTILVRARGGISPSTVVSALSLAKCPQRVYVAGSLAVRSRYNEMAYARGDLVLAHHVLDPPPDCRYKLVLNPEVILTKHWDAKAVSIFLEAELSDAATAPVILTAHPPESLPLTSSALDPPQTVIPTEAGWGVGQKIVGHSPVPVALGSSSLMFARTHTIESTPIDPRMPVASRGAVAVFASPVHLGRVDARFD